MKGPEKFIKKPITHPTEIPSLSRRALLAGGLSAAGLSLAGCGHNDVNARSLAEVNKINQKENSDSRICVKTFSGKEPSQVGWMDTDCMEWVNE